MENGSPCEGQHNVKSLAENAQSSSGSIADCGTDSQQERFIEPSAGTAMQQELISNGDLEFKGSHSEIEQALVGNLLVNQSYTDPEKSTATLLREGATVSEKEVSKKEAAERSQQSSPAVGDVEGNGVVGATREESQIHIMHASELAHAQPTNQDSLISKVRIESENTSEEVSTANTQKEISKDFGNFSDKCGPVSTNKSDPSGHDSGDTSKDETDPDEFGDFGDFEGCSTVQISDKSVEASEELENTDTAENKEDEDDFGEFSEVSACDDQKVDAASGSVKDGAKPSMLETVSDSQELHILASDSSAASNSHQGKVVSASEEELGSLRGSAMTSAVARLLLPLVTVTLNPSDAGALASGAELKPLKDSNIRLPDSSSLGLNLLHVKPVPPGFLRGSGPPVVLASRVSGFEQKLLSSLGLLDAYNQASVREHFRKQGNHEHKGSGAISDAFQSAADIDSPPSIVRLSTGSEGAQVQSEHDLDFLLHMSGGSSTHSVTKSELSFSSGDHMVPSILNPAAVKHTRDLSNIFDALANLAPSIPSAVDPLEDPTDDLPMAATLDDTPSKVLHPVNSLDLWGMGDHETLEDASARATDPDTSEGPHCEEFERGIQPLGIGSSPSALGRVSPQTGLESDGLKPVLGDPNNNIQKTSSRNEGSRDSGDTMLEAGRREMENSSAHNFDGDVILTPTAKQKGLDPGSEFTGPSEKAVFDHQYFQNSSMLYAASQRLTGVGQQQDNTLERDQGTPTPGLQGVAHQLSCDQKGEKKDNNILDSVHPEPDSLFTDDWLSNLKESKEPKSLPPKDESDDVTWGEFSDAPQIETVTPQSLGLHASSAQDNSGSIPHGIKFNPFIAGYGLSQVDSKQKTGLQYVNQANVGIFDGLSLSQQQVDLNPTIPASSALHVFPDTSSQPKYNGSDGYLEGAFEPPDVYHESAKTFPDDLQDSNSKGIQEDQWGVFQDV